MERFAGRLKELREENNLRQKDLANQLGFARTTIANYEQALRLPPPDTLFAIADVFQVSLDYLLGRTNVRSTAREILFSVIKAPILILDPLNGDIIDFNNIAKDFYGYDKETFLKMKIYDINILNRDTVRAKMSEVIKNQFGTYRFKHRIADGSIRAVQVFSGPINMNSSTHIYSIIYALNNWIDKAETLRFNKQTTILSKILKAKMPNRNRHHQNVAIFATAIGERLKLDPESLNYLKSAASIHDIGLLMIPLEIALKESDLNTYEQELHKGHSNFGAELVKDIDLRLSRIIAQHHEYIDGSGFPYGLKGEEIELEARIITVANNLENLARYKVKEVCNCAELSEHLETYSGHRYDSNIANACLELIQEGDLFS